MDKSPEAFRTISEVADSLDTPAHVLRFWESRFPQIRPVKRAGGRRYYRPSDVALLAGIKRLLHDEGLTIRGVQKILREQGIRHVAGLGSGAVALPADSEEAIEAELTAALGVPDAVPAPPQDAETAQVIALETVLQRAERQAAPPAPPPQQPDLWSLIDAGDAPEAPMALDVPEGSEGDSDEREEAPTVVAFGAAQEAVAEPPAPQDAPHPADSDQPAAAPTLAARLRAVPPAALAPDSEALAALRDRLRDLRGRLAEASRRRAR